MTIQLPQLPAAKVTGLILYKGASLINGEEIVVIATGIQKGSANIKTGAMVQIWILNASMNPLNAYETGHDASVCGDCKHGRMGTCYVNLGQGPYAVFDAYKRGKYTESTDELIAEHLTGRTIRFGAYGDPAAVPMRIWDKVLAVKGRHTAYTHQWNKPWAQELKTFCMASVDTDREYAKARKMGWRTFRVRLDSEPLMEREFVCPASHEAGKRLTCEQCCACNGGNKLATVTIITHGTSYKPRRFIAVRKRQMAKHGWQDLIPDKIKNRPVSV